MENEKLKLSLGLEGKLESKAEEPSTLPIGIAVALYDYKSPHEEAPSYSKGSRFLVYEKVKTAVQILFYFINQ